MIPRKLVDALDFQDNYEEHIREAASSIRERMNGMAEYALVMGSGLDKIAEEIDLDELVRYEDIPGFPVPRIDGHHGQMLIGDLEGVPVIGLQGRTHYYDVADEPFNTGLLRIIFPVHVMAELGVENYFVTNAAGGLNTSYGVGDVMAIKSHINDIPNPLMGRKHDFDQLSGEDVRRFPNMSNEYDQDLREILLDAGKDFNIRSGVYVAVTGPSFETRAEVLKYRKLGADAIGMSTAPEVVTALSRGMKVVGFSLITNKTLENGDNGATHKEVLEVTSSEYMRDKLSGLVRNYFAAVRDSSRQARPESPQLYSPMP